ncbi:MAG: hypothetical protein EOO23_05760, partial [Comamonadaceae bacterium]
MAEKFILVFDLRWRVIGALALDKHTSLNTCGQLDASCHAELIGGFRLLAGQNQTSAETSHATKNGMSHYSLDATGQETSLARTTLSATDIRLRSG